MPLMTQLPYAPWKTKRTGRGKEWAGFVGFIDGLGLERAVKDVLST